MVLAFNIAVPTALAEAQGPPAVPTPYDAAPRTPPPPATGNQPPAAANPAPVAGYPPQAGYPPPPPAGPGAYPYAAPSGVQAQPAMVHRARRGLVVAGAVTFGVSWSVAVAASAVPSIGDTCNDQCRAWSKEGWIPVVGPLFVAGASSDPTPLVIWSVIEAGGLAMLVVGLIGHDVPSPDLRRGPGWSLVPALSPHLGGLTLSATF
jgi:hypothetical protein